MKPFILILLLSFLGISNAQQGNHLVVQGYQEIVDTSLFLSNLDTLKNTVYYDIDLNSPEIAVSKLKSNRIKYNYYATDPTPSSSFFKLSQGYQTISNCNGQLLAYVFNNVLYNNKGDSIDYLSQYGGKRGIASHITFSDTFTLYYIQSKTSHNATSFESQYYNTNQSWQPIYKFHNDSFFLIEAKYFQNKRISKKRIKDFAKWGNINFLESNVVFFVNQFKECIVQFVWNKFFYNVNVTQNYQTYSKQIIFKNTIVNGGWSIKTDSDAGLLTSPELVVSPSGRWTVYNWYYSEYINNSYKYSVSKVVLIENDRNINLTQIASDSGNITKDKITYWKNAIFTNKDSTFLLPEITLKFIGQFKNLQVIRKILEINIQGKDITKSYFDLKLDSQYTTVKNFSGSYYPVRDLVLAPNGNNYAFIARFSPKYLTNGQIYWFLSYELAKFVKRQSYYTIVNPVLVMRGVNSQGSSSFGADAGDKIYFPATPIPYHYINFTNKSLCNDLTYEFTNESDTNWFDHFMWYWGDGDSSASHKSQPLIRHQYKKSGKYRILLKSITAAGGWVWYSDSVEILPEPIAKYHTENTVGCQWIAVEFADSSVLEKKAHTWTWDFGDGSDTLLSSANNIMPTKISIQHTYITSGKFEVQLRVSDGRCTDTFGSIQNIEILPAPRPGIAIDMTEGCTPLEVEFGRAYTDPTDSTIYEFKPILLPQNKFMQAQNKATMLDAGKFTLYQKLYGPSGCVTLDSVEILMRQGVSVDYRPELKRSTVVTNESVLTEWKSVPHVSKYQLYRNGLPHAVVNDTQFFDKLSTEIDQSYTYEVQAMDSCDRRVANKSNVGKTIYLRVKEIEPASKSEFASALLTWSPYEDWSADGGVGNYESFGNYRVESESWERLNGSTDTTINDKDFIKPKNFEKCYYIKARSAQGRYESKSNVSCLKYQATLFAPNAFTPNGDGLNDVFEVFNYGFDRFTLSIYNSWGQKVYEQNNTEGIWAPTESVPQGVYLYHIKAYRNNQEFEFSSTVTLLR